MRAAWADYYGATVPLKLAGTINAVGPALQPFAVAFVSGLVTFFSIISLCTFSSFRNPNVVNGLCVVAVVAFAGLIQNRHRGIWQLPVGIIGVFSVLAGALLGGCCYREYGYYSHIYLNSRIYNNVDPYQTAGSVSDAGRMVFAAEARVDVNASRGYSGEDGVMYCAAPILGLDEPRRVEFWAIGKDCCKTSASFECGPVADDLARGGAVLFGGPGLYGGGPFGRLLAGWQGRKEADIEARAGFDQARRKAEEALGLAADGPIRPGFVRWMSSQSLASLPRFYTMQAWVFITISIFAFACTSAPIAWLAARYSSSSWRPKLRPPMTTPPPQPRAARGP